MKGFLVFFFFVASCKAHIASRDLQELILRKDYDWYSRATSADCSTDDGPSAFCSDCFTQTICPSTAGDAPTLNSCADGYVCFQTDQFSACVDESEVQECQCPDETFVKIADNYDNQKFIACLNGEGNVEDCDTGLFFDPVSQTCVTQLPETPSDMCETDIFGIHKISCTQYIVCLSDNTNSGVVDCGPGTIFNEGTESCESYPAPFSCSDKDVDMYYVDNYDCNVYHLCIGGTQLGQDNTCPEDQVFDETEQTCSASATCTAVDVEGCDVCPDEVTRFGINCESYYQCTKDESGDLVPVVRTCPPNFAYNEVEGYCDQEENVDGCPA